MSYNVAICRPPISADDPTAWQQANALCDHHEGKAPTVYHELKGVAGVKSQHVTCDMTLVYRGDMPRGVMPSVTATAAPDRIDIQVKFPQ